MHSPAAHAEIREFLDNLAVFLTISRRLDFDALPRHGVEV